MSKFIDTLDRLSRSEPQPIGFRVSHSVSPKPKIQLVASVAEESVDGLTEQVAGADAGLLRIAKPGSGAKALQKISRAVPDIPWGSWLQGGSPKEIEGITKAGSDFVVFPATHTPLAILHSDEVGKILEVEASLSEGLLRAANELPIDAVLIAGEQGDDFFLTWQHLLLFRRFADLLTIPLLVSIPSKVTADELQALWEAGIKGVVVEVGVGQPQDRLKELRQAIDKLTSPSPHKREKAEALVPRIGMEPSRAMAEEADEEDEEEYFHPGATR